MTFRGIRGTHEGVAGRARLTLTLTLTLTSGLGQAQEKPVNLPPPTVAPESLVEPPRGTEPLPAPRWEKERRRDLMILGGGILISSWVADRVVAQDYSFGWNWVPVVGPFILLNSQVQLGQLTPTLGAALVLDGIGQLAGAAMVVLGAAVPRKRMVLRLPRKAVSLQMAPAPAGWAVAF